MANITLSAAVRQNLLALQQTADLMAQTQNRLATGRKVNSAIDNPTAFFISQGLNNRANDLSGLLDGMSNAISTIKAADAGISAITKLVQQQQSIISQARQTSDATVLGNLEDQFDELSNQIDLLAADSGFNGTNLINGDDLTIDLNEDASSQITVTGVTEDSATLGITAALDWTTAANIDTDAGHLTDALTTLRSDAATLGSSLSTVQIRQDFTKAMISTLRTGADNLTLADTNEEGANLLALQTRQQLSTTSLALAAQAEQNVLRLFG